MRNAHLQYNSSLHGQATDYPLNQVIGIQVGRGVSTAMRRAAILALKLVATLTTTVSVLCKTVPEVRVG